MLRRPPPPRQSGYFHPTISMQHSKRDNLPDWRLQDPLPWSSFYVDRGAKSGRFLCQKPANGAMLALYLIPVVHALIAVYLYATGTTYKQFTGLEYRLGIPFTDLLEDCIVDPNDPNDMLRPFCCPCIQLVPGRGEALLQLEYRRQSASLCCPESMVCGPRFVSVVLEALCKPQARTPLKQDTGHVFAGSSGPCTFCWVHARYWDDILAFGASILLVWPTSHRAAELPSDWNTVCTQSTSQLSTKTADRSSYPLSSLTAIPPSTKCTY